MICGYFTNRIQISQINLRADMCFPLHNVQAAFEACTTFYPSSTYWRLFLGGEQFVQEFDHGPPPSVEIRVREATLPSTVVLLVRAAYSGFGHRRKEKLRKQSRQRLTQDGRSPQVLSTRHNNI
jgi:hypothetical protein